MPSHTKTPANPNPGIYGEPPELQLPTDMFDGITPASRFSSRYLKDDADAINYFKDLYERIKLDGKGKTVFPDADTFLHQLDEALLHFDMFRDCVNKIEGHSFTEQRAFFKKLHKAAEQLDKAFNKMTDLHVTRLAHNGIELRKFSNKKLSSHDLKHNIKDLLTATQSTQKELKSKNAGRHAELYLLIEQLKDMYSNCSGKNPSLTKNTHNPDNNGVFFELVKAVIPLTQLENSQYITDSSIIEGIKLLRK